MSVFHAKTVFATTRQDLNLSSHRQPARVSDSDYEDLEDLDFTRRSGFYSHQSEQKKFDKSREAGLSEWVDEQERLARQREKLEAQYRNSKKPLVTNEEGPEYQTFLAEQRKQAEQYEASRSREAAQQSAFKRRRAQKHLALTEEEELDVFMKRPKYDTRKRVLYGAKSKLGKSGSQIGGAGGLDSSKPGDNFSSSPLPFNQDFGDNFTPPIPPTFSDAGFGDIPPPPPPPPPAFPDSFDGGAGEFIPPPPPFENFE